MRLDIVTGTYNRVDLLRRMIESARRYLHFGLSYRFVVVDGGSTDATIPWCHAQPDVLLIEQGALLGAVKAFTDGAYAATAEYVLLCNDDLEWVDYSIVAAVAYLDEHPQCGAVAFADDRPAQSKPAGYHVQTMTVLSPEGWQISIPYAQVGLYRRWLGDLCGWWGAYDPEFISHTYGGDNYLTARIIEHGYTVDAVRGVRVKDLVHEDILRKMNQEHEIANTRHGGGYYARFLTPPQMRHGPAVSNPEGDKGLRILYLPIFEPSYPHHRAMKRGLREALMRKGTVIEVDYVNEPYNLVDLVTAWQPHILFTQFQRNAEQFTDVARARAAQPDMLVFNWNGDVYLDALVTPETLAWLRENVDVQLVVNGAALPVYKEHGITAAYWQCAYEPVNESMSILPEHAYEIVMMGSAYSDKRRELARALISLPYSVGLVGSGWVKEFEPWNAGNSTYQFELSNAIRRSVKIEVGDNQYATDTGFVSNRIFDCLAAGGALLLHQRVDCLEDFTGLRAGAHYIEWLDIEDLKEKIAYWMHPKREAKRLKIVRQAYDEARTHHSFDARLRELFGKDGILARAL